MIFDGCELIEVAYIVKSHGLKGQLSVKMFDNFSHNVFKEKIPVFLDVKGIPVPFFIEQKKNAGNGFLVKLKHIDSEETANNFRFCSIYIAKNNIKEESEECSDEKWELYDYEVFDRKYGYIGKIKNLNLIPGNPVFETEFNGKLIILPYSEDFIINIDDENKKLEIDAPGGLIDLYLN
ncbi:MAG: ribosome maturation factor RimM [Bacteroidales bacterium]|jgi:16S rRNA processing protein RimM|nr:ribosome maturation factor RimM [Bacteroidales bacterium]